jgi:pyridoxamine 5'-phosphate oxidase family protein
LFSEAEVKYLKSQRLARIATASTKGAPELSPVAFKFDGSYFWVGNSPDIFPRTR